MSIKLNDLIPAVHETAFIIGDNFEEQSPAFESRTGTGIIFAPPQFWSLRASSVGALGLRRILRNDLDDPYHIKPVYLRPPDIRSNAFVPPLTIEGKADSIRSEKRLCP